MISGKTIYNQKNISMTKAVLAAMWHLKEAGKDKLLSHKYIRSLCQDKHKNTYRSCIFRLCKTKLLKRDYNNVLALTDKGERRALSAFIEAESALHKKGNQHWDGGWRMVFFDIPENKRKYRDYLRKILKLVGFHEFQQSIWVYPYPVPAFLKDLMFEKNIKPYVRCITTNYVDNDQDLRIIFGLFGAE